MGGWWWCYQACDEKPSIRHRDTNFGSSLGGKKGVGFGCLRQGVWSACCAVCCAVLCCVGGLTGGDVMLVRGKRGMQCVVFQSLPTCFDMRGWVSSHVRGALYEPPAAELLESQTGRRDWGRRGAPSALPCLALLACLPRKLSDLQTLPSPYTLRLCKCVSVPCTSHVAHRTAHHHVSFAYSDKKAPSQGSCRPVDHGIATGEGGLLRARKEPA